MCLCVCVCVRVCLFVCVLLYVFSVQVVERPQYMLLRVALGIHGHDIEAALETYELMYVHTHKH